MPPRDTVRDAQRRLAELDTACRRATTKLGHATARRAALLDNQDRLAQLAREGPDRDGPRGFVRR
jgi:hypothetical protein